MAETEAALRARFEAAGQGQVFRYLDEGKVPQEEKEALLAQLRDLDLVYVAKSLAAALAEAEQGISSADLSPPDDFTALADAAAADVASWEEQGLKAVARGEVVACLLAGGQGTRLGFDGPKGCYDIGLPSGKPLFQLCAERIRRLEQLAGVGSRVPFAVMTSPGNDAETRQFFRERNFFGLSEDNVFFFAQGTLPCVTKEGKIIMESAGVVSLAPDGNGGLYPALAKSGVLAKLMEQGAKYLHVFSVDNALCRPADPRFVGYCVAKGADCGNKCVWKASPEEKVGVVAKRAGKSSVVEYSELDEARKNQRDEAGRLVFGAGNICNHFFSLQFLAETVLPNMAAMFHLAHKKIPYADESGKTVKPEGNNGIKLEAFVFDVFPMSSRMAILETKREEEFAPVKNAPGAAADSPDTARAMVSALAKSWLTAAGFTLPEAEIVEVSPLVSYAGEGLEAKLEALGKVAPVHLQ